MTPPGPVSRDAAAAAARAELSKSGYRRDQPNFIERFVNALIDQVTRGLQTVSNAVPGGPLGVLLILLLVAGLITLVVLRLGPGRVREILGERRPGPTGPRSASDYRSEADALATAGDLAGAVRASTRAMVRELEQRGILEPTPGSTTAALSRQAALAVPVVGPDAALVTAVFDDVWYAGRLATPADVAQVRAAELRVKAQRLRVSVPT